MKTKKLSVCFGALFVATLILFNTGCAATQAAGGPKQPTAVATAPSTTPPAAPTVAAKPKPSMAPTLPNITQTEDPKMVVLVGTNGAPVTVHNLTPPAKQRVISEEGPMFQAQLVKEKRMEYDVNTAEKAMESIANIAQFAREYKIPDAVRDELIKRMTTPLGFKPETVGDAAPPANVTATGVDWGSGVSTHPTDADAEAKAEAAAEAK